MIVIAKVVNGELVIRAVVGNGAKTTDKPDAETLTKAVKAARN
jgi:hypothetical protein